MYTLAHELELKRTSRINFARLLDCLERIVNREVSHVYEWPVVCENYMLDMCTTESAQYADWCRNQLQTPSLVKKICQEYFERCLKESYGGE